MNTSMQPWYVSGWVWWVRRNPSYLLSAACMACGARLYLVDPDSYAGDLGVILLTLGVLQVYEWAVTSTLLVLHRAQRAPEDRGSLLLVAALFWTGPLAATIEMTALDAQLGFLCAAGVVLFAVLELSFVESWLTLRLSNAARLAALGCLGLVFLAPWGLRVAGAEGTNEWLLFGCWWTLAALSLCGLGCLRARSGHGLWRELAFITIILACTATHLVGMNYAFVGHARPFYATPVLLALGIVACEAARRPKTPAVPLRLAVALLPALAIGLSLDSFDPAVALAAVPAWLRQPAAPTLALAGLVWWFAAWRLGSVGFFHAASAAAALGILAVWPSVPTDSISAPLKAPLMRNMVTSILFALTGYLLAVGCVRRSRREAVFGLTVLQFAVASTVSDDTRLAVLVCGLTLCWSLLLAMHLGERRPQLAHVFWTIVLMLALTWVYDFDPQYRWPARVNTLVLVWALFVAGQLWPATRYQRVAIGVIAANALFFAGRMIALGVLSLPTLVAAAAFALLACGALVSWHKRSLLAAVQTTPSIETAPDTNASEPDST